MTQRITTLVLFSAFAVAATLDDEIRDRLSPAGSVCVVGDDCAAGLAVAGGPGGPRDAESVYGTFCVACHATGVSEAPILGNAEQWAPRIAKGLDVLYSSAIKSFRIPVIAPTRQLPVYTDLFLIFQPGFIRLLPFWVL